MRDLWGSRWILAGIAGAFVGAVIEALVTRLAGRILFADGIVWGAVLAIVLVSLPNFGQMGRMVVKSDRRAVHFLVGILVFVLISVLLVTVFLGIFLLVGRLLS